MKQILVLLVSWFALLSSASALTGFETKIHELQRECPYLESCGRRQFDLQHIYNRSEGHGLSLGEDLLTPLQTVAREQAGVWADTILEGDYYADRAVVLEEIEVLRERGELIGYRITYSAKAWQTHICNFDGESVSSLRGCTEGRIVEKSFVSADLSSWIRDDANYAEFQ